LSLSLVVGLESNEALVLYIGGIGSTKLDDGVEGANLGDPFNKL
jgi:hypothetical protein